MKFHNDLKTVLISIAVLMLFIFSSVFIISELDLTSPTLIVTNTIFNSFVEKDSDISVSFSSMERNFRDRVRVNDIEVFYKDEALAKLDYVEVKIGILDLISYLITGKATPEVVASNGEIIISKALFDSDTSIEENAKEEKESGNWKYKFSVVLDNMTISIFDQYKINNVNLSLLWSGGLNKMKASLAIPEIHFMSDGYALDVSSFYASIISESNIKLDFGFQNALVSGNSLKSGIGYSKGSLEIESFSTLENYKGRIDVDSLEGDFSGFVFRTSPINIFLSQEENTLKIDDLEIKYNDIEAKATNIYLDTKDYVSFGGGIATISGQYSNIPFTINSLNLNDLDISDKTAEFKIESIGVDNLQSYTSSILKKGDIKNLSVASKISDEINLSLGFDSIFTPVGNLSKDIEMGFDLSLSLFEDQIKEFSVSSRNIYLGYGERRPNHIDLKGKDNTIYLGVEYGEFALNLEYGLSEKRIKGEVDIKDYSLSSLYHFFSKEIGSLNPYVPSDSLLSLNLSLDFLYKEEQIVPVEGDVKYKINLSEADAFAFKSQLSSNGSIKLEKDQILFDTISFDTSYFSVSLNGNLPYSSMLPSIDFTLSLPDDREAIKGSIKYEDPSYVFFLDFPTINETSLRGKMSYNEEGIIGNSTLTTMGNERPFIFNVDTNDYSFGLSSPKVGVTGSYREGVECNLVIRNLDLVKDNKGNPLLLNGDLYFDYKNGSWNINSNNIALSNLWFIPSSPDITFGLQSKEQGLEINNIRFSIDGTSYFEGVVNVDLKDNVIAGSFDALLGEGDVVFSFGKDQLYTGFVRTRKLDLSPFGIRDMYVDVNLMGRASTLANLSLEGKILAVGYDNVNDDRKVTADIVINSDSLLLDNIRFTTSGLSMEIDSIDWSAEKGIINIGQGRLKVKGEHADRDYPMSANFSLSVSMNNDESIYNSVYNTLRDGGDGISLEIILDSIDIDNSRIVVEKRTTIGKVKDRRIDFTGSLLSGWFNLDDRKFNLSLDLYPLASLSLWGDLKDGIKANSEIHAFNMYFINMFMYAPLITFDECFVSGEAGIIEDNGTYSINGNLSADEIGVNIFWAPDQKVIIHNPRFTMWNNDLRCSVAKATVIDYLTYERKSIDIYAGLTLTPTLSLEGYVAEMWMDENNTIRIRLPLPMVGVDILANGYGHYYMQTIDGEPMINDGELTMVDSEVTIGMNPYPEWYTLEGSSDVDMIFNLKRNNRIIYPAGADPIISITLDEDSSVKFVKDGDNISVTGDVDIRGGEIFYFQKYFYITEGNISFPDPTKLDPKINLRATLRDYDSDSNRVEVYLVMKDNTFENINPTLESSPAKDLNEIMSILGQSILPSSTYGTVSVGSVTQLLTEGIDILGRLGIVTTSNPTSGLTQSLKNVFGVDSFSLHSNIVNNILSDTISSSLTENYSSYSPMARYLDGTTLNIGKYLSSSFYLQGMIHLSANKNAAKDKYTFISDDLILDTEFSLEWMNPAFKITFMTSPSYFSLYSVMNTFRFSISKIINF